MTGYLSFQLESLGSVTHRERKLTSRLPKSLNHTITVAVLLRLSFVFSFTTSSVWFQSDIIVCFSLRLLHLSRTKRIERGRESDQISSRLVIACSLIIGEQIINLDEIMIYSNINDSSSEIHSYSFIFGKNFFFRSLLPLSYNLFQAS